MYIIHAQSPPPPRTECPKLNLPFSDPPKRGADFLRTVRNVYAKIVPKLLALKQRISRISADVLNNHVSDPGFLCRVILAVFTYDLEIAPIYELEELKLATAKEKVNFQIQNDGNGFL